MIAFSDAHRIELARGMLDRGSYEEAVYMLRSVNTSEARQIRADASYRLGKLLVSEGQYGSAREYFALAAQHHTVPVVRRLAQERNSLIRDILERRARAVSTMVGQYAEVKVAEAMAMHPETFAPLISFVGCPAAYRSNYDPERSDPLSQLIRRIKRGSVDTVVTAERESAAERVGEILAAYAHTETSILKDADFIVPVPSDQERHAERGYSFPMIMAAKVSVSCAIPLNSQVIETTGPLPDLRRIPRWARALAVTDAYRGTERSGTLDGMNVVIVDDVVTTGATLTQIAFVLKDYGAGKVSALVLAHSESSRY